MLHVFGLYITGVRLLIWDISTHTCTCTFLYTPTHTQSHIHTLDLPLNHKNEEAISVGVDSGGQPGHAPPIIRMGGKNPFLPPPIIRREFFNFVYLKKNK